LDRPPLNARVQNYNDGFPYSAPVGSFPLEHYGLRDLGGNVWEFCEDMYDSEQGGRRVARGGVYHFAGFGAYLSSERYPKSMTYRSNMVGFRCVLETGGCPGKATQASEEENEALRARRSGST
jgi:formylglycine-generating enzyme required for sulfatase activity